MSVAVGESRKPAKTGGKGKAINICQSQNFYASYNPELRL